MNVTESIRRHAQRAPDAEAYVSARGETFTYGVVERTIDALAVRLLDLGLVPGNIVAIATNDLYRHTMVGLALARVGVAQATINLPAQRTDLAILDPGLEGNGCTRSVGLVDLWSADLLTRGATNPVPIHEDGNALLACFASSGTTGVPKFVPVTHELALRRLDIHALGLAGGAGGRGTPSARQACYVGPGTSYGFSSFMLVLGGGGTIIERNLEAAELATWIVRSRATYMVMSPGTLQQIAGVLPATRNRRVSADGRSRRRAPAEARLRVGTRTVVPKPNRQLRLNRERAGRLGTGRRSASGVGCRRIRVPGCRNPNCRRR